MVDPIAQFSALTQATFRLSSLLAAERDRAVADLGLTSARWQVLEAVGAQAAPVSAASLGRLLHISRQAVQRVLNDLAGQGLIRLDADETDRRVQLAMVTPAGASALEELVNRTEFLHRKFVAECRPLVTEFVDLVNAGCEPGASDSASPQDASRSHDDRSAPRAARPTEPAAASTARTFEIVRDHILDAIHNGQLQSGNRLPPERELASDLGVGRAAVREALRSLEMSGILSFKRGAGGGAFVRESGSDGIEDSIRSMLILGRLPLTDLLEVRASLLGQCARLGAQRATEQDFLRLERNIDELERCVRTYNDQVAAIEPATEFYRLAAKSTHNRLMVLLMDAIADLVAEMLRQLKHRPRPDSVIARREMVAAMRAGKPDEAARVIRDHSYDTNRLLLRNRRPFTQHD